MRQQFEIADEDVADLQRGVGDAVPDVLLMSLRPADVRGLPDQMLPAVHRDHLAGDGGRRPTDSAPPRTHPSVRRRCQARSPRAGGRNRPRLWRALIMVGPGPTALTRMRGRQRLRQRRGEPVKPRLAEAVGEELRRGLQHALIDDVDDGAVRVSRQPGGRMPAPARRARAGWSPCACPSFRGWRCANRRSRTARRC